MDHTTYHKSISRQVRRANSNDTAAKVRGDRRTIYMDAQRQQYNDSDP